MKVTRKRLRKRIIRHGIGGKYAKSVIGEIRPRMELYMLTDGQFSFINVIEAIIGQMNEPADLAISSWTVAKFEMGRLKYYLDTGMVSGIRFITDRSFKTRHPDLYAILVDLLGVDNVRLIRCHCKFAIITSPWNIALRTSANLNENRRIENFEISDDSGRAGYMLEFTDKLFSHPFDMSGIKLSDLKQKSHPNDEGDIITELDSLLKDVGKVVGIG